MVDKLTPAQIKAQAQAKAEATARAKAQEAASQAKLDSLKAAKDGAYKKMQQWYALKKQLIIWNVEQKKLSLPNSPLVVDGDKFNAVMRDSNSLVIPSLKFIYDILNPTKTTTTTTNGKTAGADFVTIRGQISTALDKLSSKLRAVELDYLAKKDILANGDAPLLHQVAVRNQIDKSSTVTTGKETNTVNKVTNVKDVVTKTATGFLGTSTADKVERMAAAAGESINADAQDVLYNVSGVKSIYLRSGQGYDKGHWLIKNNSPSVVKDAMDLWTTSQGHKGMFQTFFGEGTYNSYQNVGGEVKKTVLPQRYGFQFHYNPTTVSMAYSSVLVADPNFAVASKNATNYVPAEGGGGTISFQIVINRIEDMSHYYNYTDYFTDLAIHSGNPSDYNLYKVNKLKDIGTLKHGHDEVYANRKPNRAEQKAIYNKGTMYDVEYLLRTVSGVTMHSVLRDEETADMGWYIKRMVDLHLGPKMRYRGFLVGLTVTHVLFDERMVPVLSYIDLGFDRRPDITNSVNSLTNKKA